jgi:mRNA interferase MazF
MNRGDIYFADLEPARGNEANKRRPAIIVSNNATNRVAQRLGRGVVTVVPVTSNTHRVLSFHTLLPAGAAGLKVDSKAQAEQVRTISIERLGTAIGTVPPEFMTRVDAALRLHLNL